MAPLPPDLREAGGGGVTATRQQAALGKDGSIIYRNETYSLPFHVALPVDIFVFAAEKRSRRSRGSRSSARKSRCFSAGCADPNNSAACPKPARGIILGNLISSFLIKFRFVLGVASFGERQLRKPARLKEEASEEQQMFCRRKRFKFFQRGRHT